MLDGGFLLYDSEYGYYTSFSAPNGKYSSAIDHILVTEGTQVKAFGTICNEYTLYTSDHSPVLIDISFE